MGSEIDSRQEESRSEGVRIEIAGGPHLRFRLGEFALREIELAQGHVSLRRLRLGLRGLPVDILGFGEVSRGGVDRP